jgi:hypothetical protein
MKELIDLRDQSGVDTIIIDVPLGWWEQEIRVYSEFGMKAATKASVMNTKRLMDNVQIDMEQ